MHKIIIISAIWCIFIHPLQAQTISLPGVLNELPAIHSESNIVPSFRGPTNNSLEEALNTAFDSITNASTLLGFNAAINLPDGTIWKRAKGLAGSAAGDTMTTNHAMGIGSTTKTFTAVTILKLQEEGLLNINDTISTYLTEIPFVNPDITIRQLLQHTSGIYNYTEHPNFTNAVFSDPDYFWPPGEILNNFLLQPLFTPGTNWSYSNSNYLLLGMIIEAVTNQPYYEVVRSRILEPLGMVNTYCYPQESNVVPFADVWLDIDGNGTIECIQDFLPMSGFFSAAYSAGAIVSTPEEVAFFFKKLLNQELLQSSSFNDMFFLYPLEPTGTFGYGLGIYNSWFCSEFGWGHNGNIIYQSENVTIPAKEISISVLSNDARTGGNIIGPADVQEVLVNVICTFTPVATAEIPVENIQVFPNPVSDVINIRLADNGYTDMKLYDLTGRLIKKSALNVAENVIDVRDLNDGLYLLQITDADGHSKGFKIYKN